MCAIFFVRIPAICFNGYHGGQQKDGCVENPALCLISHVAEDAVEVVYVVKKQKVNVLRSISGGCLFVVWI